MAEDSTPNAESAMATSANSSLAEVGQTSKWLTQNGFEHDSLGLDKAGIEVLKVERDFLVPIATALYAYGFNYLQCQGGYLSLIHI